MEVVVDRVSAGHHESDHVEHWRGAAGLDVGLPVLVLCLLQDEGQAGERYQACAAFAFPDGPAHKSASPRGSLQTRVSLGGIGGHGGLVTAAQSLPRGAILEAPPERCTILAENEADDCRRLHQSPQTSGASNTAPRHIGMPQQAANRAHLVHQLQGTDQGGKVCCTPTRHTDQDAGPRSAPGSDY